MCFCVCIVVYVVFLCAFLSVVVFVCFCVCFFVCVLLSIVVCVCASASFSLVSSPSLGVYRMQMGQVTLEVSSGDITKEASDVIVNSSNQDFTLKSGEAMLLNSPGLQSRPMILTSAGRLPCRGIVHIVGQNDPLKIKDMVCSVLKTCEHNKFSSVCFPALGTAALPSHWDDMKGDLMKLFDVSPGSKEYSDVEKEMKKTGLAANIISRVQNTTLFQSYQLMKKQLEVKNKHKNNERLLFHGTGSSAIDLINKQGFNRSYAGAHGVMYGNGSYFAVDPRYSAQGYAQPDANGHKRMYQARVLVGDFTKGHSGLITPPAKGSGNSSDLFDSVADNKTNPTMFVIFNDIQAYPEYLITFT
uniref:Poly [ADP-ribose] polymerase n=1 Tax=Amphiprion ocellaris TaxID=80972 RepID=A0A3Q1CRV3_AMPOC